jgi:hypothetical protein
VTGTDEMDGGQIASVEQQKAIVEEYEKQPEFMGTLPCHWTIRIKALLTLRELDLEIPSTCYACHEKFFKLHFFYDRVCYLWL